MTRRVEQMVEDRCLRDAAKALLDTDIQNIRNNLTGKSIASRAVDRFRDSAADVYDEAVAVASDNKGALAALLAALAIWLFRNPLRSLFEGDAVDVTDDEAGEEYGETDFATER